MELLWLFVSVIVSIGLHKSAHGWSAVLCRLKVTSVRLGMGPAIVKWRVKGIDFFVGYPWTLFIGHVDVQAPKNTPIGPRLFVASAGLLVNAVIVILCGFGYVYVHRWVGIWESLGLVNLIMLITNATPFVVAQRGKTKLLTDGGQIAALLKETRTVGSSSKPR